MSSAGLKLNPAIAKLTSNGQVHCIVCNTQVKPKVWLAHVNGRKHKEATEILKQRLTGGPKRVAEQSVTNGAPPNKKTKEDTTASTTEGGSELPADFFDDDSNKLSIQTPWQKAKQEEKELLQRERPGLIEGVPQGFFDDKRKDNMVRETQERNAQLDEEYDKLMREVNEQHTEEEQKADEDAEREARERDIANIDEQMGELKKLNELEIRKEQLMQQAQNRKRQTVAVDSDSDDDGGEMDFDNWRAKRIL